MNVNFDADGKTGTRLPTVLLTRKGNQPSGFERSEQTCGMKLLIVLLKWKENSQPFGTKQSERISWRSMRRFRASLLRAL